MENAVSIPISTHPTLFCFFVGGAEKPGKVVKLSWFTKAEQFLGHPGGFRHEEIKAHTPWQESYSAFLKGFFETLVFSTSGQLLTVACFILNNNLQRIIRQP